MQHNKAQESGSVLLSFYFSPYLCLRQVLDILQHIQALDPSQHGAVGYLVQHTLEHIQHKRHVVEPEVKRRSAPEHSQVQYSVGLIMKHKRCVFTPRRERHLCEKSRVS